MAVVGETSGEFEKKPARVKDKPRKPRVVIPGGENVNFGTGVGGITGGTGVPASTGQKRSYKKKPKRNQTK